MSVDSVEIKELLTHAQRIRRGEEIEPDQGFEIARQLADAQYLEQARRLAECLRSNYRFEPSVARKLRQQLALWTSKNPDAADDRKHDQALVILDDPQPGECVAGLATTTDPETLGIAGGICKRKWLLTGDRQILEQALSYYERGAQAGIAADDGYTAVNAAFILDLLAVDSATQRNELSARAARFREDVRDTLVALKDQLRCPGDPPRDATRWFHETLAEAYFGLGAYARATAHLKRANNPALAELAPKPWERETTARQFAWLARLRDPAAKSGHEFETSAAWQALREVYGENSISAATSLFAGKFGIGLSGGGFRSSLFHIGVFAALAERDLLRHVEVLSCVSGGSIIGAYYYLEVRQLLQTKGDREITRQDYVELVARMSREFLRGVQKNLRVRIGTNLLANLRMLFGAGYTPTNRLGDLYEEHLYGRINDDKTRVLRELFVKPKGQENCKPKYDNWQRANKIPILVLNATALNTGHNWQFTASWMGEPPAAIDSEIDGNYRLRRMYWDAEVPAALRDFRLGQAVAASSCVPGLFAPLELRDLYDGITIRLVDGGVHDNQGTSSLLEQNCNVMLVSDASGQMAAIDAPPDNPFGVLLRTTGILQSRVRTAEYRELESRRLSGRLKELVFLHMKKDLEVEDRDWKGCQNPKEIEDSALRKQRGDLTSYGVLKDFQRLLADVRTDLDSFNDTEAYALMASGCKMARASLRDALKSFPHTHEEFRWVFLTEPDLVDSTESHAAPFKALLNAAKQVPFKIWCLSPVLRGCAIAGGLGIAGGALWAAWTWRAAPIGSLRGVAAAIASAAFMVGASAAGLQLVVRMVKYRKTLYQILVGAALATLGWVAMNIHLLAFDRWYLRRGRLALKDSTTPRS